MDWITTKITSRKYFPKAASDLCDCLPKYYIDIFAALDANRQYIHNLKKIFESKFGAQKTASIDPPGKQVDKVLNLLGKVHFDLNSLQSKFNEVSGQELLKNLKALEADYEHIFKLSADLVKTKNDLKKAQKKKMEDENNSKDFNVTNLEIDKSAQTEALKNALIRYSLDESSRSESIRSYLRQQLKFFEDCMATANELLTNANQTMSSNVYTTSFFGTSISEHTNDHGYSEVLETCVNYLISHECYKLQGMFREAGQMSRIQILRDAFDKRMVTDELLEFCGHNVVGDVLKQYLRELKEPLLPKRFVEQWKAARDHMTPETAYNLLRDLPAPNQNNFIAFIRFLGKIVENKNTSRMNSTNLSTVLCMNLFWIKPETSLSDSQAIVPVIQYLSDNCALIFKDDISIGVLKPRTPEPLQVGGGMLNNTALSRGPAPRPMPQNSGAPSTTPNIPTRSYRTSIVDPRKMPNPDGSFRQSKPPAPPVPAHHTDPHFHYAVKEQPLSPEPCKPLTPEFLAEDREKSASPAPVPTEVANRSSPLETEEKGRASVTDTDESENEEDEDTESEEESELGTTKHEDAKNLSEKPSSRKNKP